MRLHILSDLHLSVAPLEVPRVAADVVVLAGDIARPTEAIAWASGFDAPVLYVPGNHEFYGGAIDGTVAELRALCAGTNVELLERDEVFVGGVRFLGTTLWTDFRLNGDAEARDGAMQLAQTLIRDFSRIRRHAAAPAPFTPADSAELFEAQAAWLSDRLAQPNACPTVVITHHAPSARSVPARFADSPLNPAFASAADRLVDGGRALLWIHGHMHDSFDYVANGTRVLCNPRGYAKDGVNENAGFDPTLTVDLHVPSATRSRRCLEDGRPASLSAARRRARPR
jgi:Icc-related predicted phosphoesterase